MFSGLLFGSQVVEAATIKINSNSTNITVGDTATLSVVVDSEGFAINNAEAVIKFPTDLFDVVSVSKSSSVFSLWVEDPAFSNSAGNITFNGGLPTPGYNGSQGQVVSFVVRAKKAGQGEITFSSAAVRANDGLGTDVLNSKRGKSITIAAKTSPIIEETPTTPETPATKPPVTAASLQITSLTHPDQEVWYKDNNPIFGWKLPTGVSDVQTALDDSVSGSPRITYSPAISEKAVKDLTDGIWYFKVRARKDGSWGPVSTYTARIDNTAPVSNTVTFTYDDNEKVLDIKADIVDETSGLDYYEIYINDSLVNKVPATDFTNGNYQLAVDTPGNNSIKLVAVDRAGNSIESSGAFQATAVPEESQPTPSVDERLLVTVGSFSAPVAYVALVIILISIILVMGAFMLGYFFSKSRNKHKARTTQAKGENVKALLLLKKRLEKHLELLQRTRHKRVLSKEEKDIKETIEGDLDEVDKAIEEQKKK